MSAWANENALKDMSDNPALHEGIIDGGGGGDDDDDGGAEIFGDRGIHRGMYSGWTSTVQRVGGDVDLYRVTFSISMMDGRQERFVTYVTRK